MMFTKSTIAAVMACLAIGVVADDPKQNTNEACGTASDIDHDAIYSYATDDVQDFGFYTQSTGTCDAGSSAQVHLFDPNNNEYQCDFAPLDGKLALINCPGLPRNSMALGVWTVYWETTPGANAYSWNQFTVQHSQATVTLSGITNTITSTPLSVISTTITTTSFDTKEIPQQTVTSPSATMVNTIKVTPPATTITTTTTSYYSIGLNKYALATITAYTTAPCKPNLITKDMTGKGKKTELKNTIRTNIFEFLARLKILRARGDDVPNKSGMPGQALTKTITPDAVYITVTASTTSTQTITSTNVIPGGTITVTNPVATTTVYSGQAVRSTTVTLPQVTKSIVRQKLALTYLTSTITLTHTKKVVTTPNCAPTPI